MPLPDVCIPSTHRCLPTCRITNVPFYDYGTWCYNKKLQILNSITEFKTHRAPEWKIPYR